MIVLILATRCGGEEILYYAKNEEMAKIQIKEIFYCLRFYFNVVKEEQIGDELVMELNHPVYTKAIIRGE